MCKRQKTKKLGTKKAKDLKKGDVFNSFGTDYIVDDVFISYFNLIIVVVSYFSTILNKIIPSGTVYFDANKEIKLVENN